jgi:adenosylcobyric acid synthase
MNARPLFVGGTSSNAGKSWMVTAICAWLHRRGVSVAPFKAQNMSNHSYPCRGGGEIGRAQVAQAEACGLEPEPAMNPILLKPSGAGSSQVVVNGRVWKTMTAREYYAAAGDLRSTVLDAYADLASRYDVIVMEGAGSVSELNLRDHDLVNLGLVTAVRAPWIGGRHGEPANAGRTRAVSWIRDQQVPRRPLPVRRRRAHPGGADGFDMPGCVSVCRRHPCRR